MTTGAHRPEQGGDPLMAAEAVDAAGNAGPRPRPTLAEREAQERLREIGGFAADLMLGRLMTAYVGARMEACGHARFEIGEVRELRQIVAMAERAGAERMAETDMRLRDAAAGRG